MLNRIIGTLCFMFYLSVSGCGGSSVSSDRAGLSTTTPSNVTVEAGQTATFSTTASGGTTPYSYRWQVLTNGEGSFTDIPGATLSSYTTDGLNHSSNGYQYRVVVADATSARVTSNAATLTVNSNGTGLSTTTPFNVTVAAGQTATFSTTASGGTAPYSYQWQVLSSGGGSFTDIPGATSSSYTTDELSLSNNGAQYRVVVKDAASGSVTSNVTTLTVTTVVVNKTDQTIAFTSTPPSPSAIGGTYTVTATGGASGNAVAFSIDGASSVGACSISGNLVSFATTGSCIIDANQAGNSNYNAATQIQQIITVAKADQSITFTSTPTDTAVGGTYTVSATGGASGNSAVFSIDASSSSGACSINGTVVSFTDAGTCIIDANQAGDSNYNAAAQAQQTINVEILPAPYAPSAVTAVPGAGQVTVSWSAPAHTGGSTIIGYTVTYGPTGTPTNYNLVASNCNPTAALSCVVTGLNNNTEYSFKVTTSSNHGTAAYLAGYSSSVMPTNGLAINPSTLALSSLGSGGIARVITLTNTSNAPITLSAVPVTYSDFSPNLPNDVTLGTTCSTSTPLNANGGFCTVTITPGTTASNDNTSAPCTGGTAPVASSFQVSSGYSINAVVLGYGCQYQGGYLFSVDDSTSATGNIGGTVAALTPQSNIEWSLTLDSIWGIDDSSIPATPSPNDTSLYAATLSLGQTNCDGSNDGACNSNNILAFPGYGTGTNYAAGVCAQSIDAAGNSPCQGGSSCFTDWYLPSICEMDDQFISLNSQACSSTQSMQSTINTFLQFDNFWSSTGYSLLPQEGAFVEHFNPGASSGTSSPFFKTSFTIGAWCVRHLTP